MTRGFVAARENKSSTRVRLHLERVTPMGIEVRVLSVDAMMGKTQERLVDLRWNDFWGSAGRIAQKSPAPY